MRAARPPGPARAVRSTVRWCLRESVLAHPQVERAGRQVDRQHRRVGRQGDRRQRLGPARRRLRARTRSASGRGAADSQRSMTRAAAGMDDVEELGPLRRGRFRHRATVTVASRTRDAPNALGTIGEACRCRRSRRPARTCRLPSASSVAVPCAGGGGPAPRDSVPAAVVSLASTPGARPPTSGGLERRGVGVGPAGHRRRGHRQVHRGDVARRAERRGAVAEAVGPDVGRRWGSTGSAPSAPTPTTPCWGSEVSAGSTFSTPVEVMSLARMPGPATPTSCLERDVVASRRRRDSASSSRLLS